MSHLLSILLLLLATCLPVAGQFVIDPYRFAVPSLTANTAVFDGTNDYQRKATNLITVADGKAATLSFWVRFDGGDGTQQTIYQIEDSITQRFWVDRAASTTNITVRAWNSGGTLILSSVITNVLETSSTWHHIFMAFDLANSSNRHAYVDGSETTVSWTTYTDDTIDFMMTDGRVVIGANRANSTRLFGALAEFWFDDSYFNDPTRFRNAGGHPISLGATGNLPTGSAPVLYLSLNGSGDSWATDSSGNGNTFTVTGALGSTTSP